MVGGSPAGSASD